MTTPLTVLQARVEDADGLMACVHCGFCLPACPTYRRLGDEADSPRGRLHLMRAVAEGRLEPSSDAFTTHLDRCLGCRACEPVCPSGVPYGHLLEEARAVANVARSYRWLTAVLLRIFGSRFLSGLAGSLGRVTRGSPLPKLIIRWGPGRVARQAMAMLGATREDWRDRIRSSSQASTARPSGVEGEPRPLSASGRRAESLVQLAGCVQRGLFGRVNQATERVLECNGYTLRAWRGEGCCGALHSHAGDLERARKLARHNIETFEKSGADGVAVNAAGCGAAMRDYHSLLADDPVWADRAERFSDAVRDVSEWLSDVGPRSGASLPTTVAYDPPCHLLHAQGVDGPVEQMLNAIPGLELRPVRDAGECCGGAGIYALTQGDLGDRIGQEKAANVRGSGASICATGNPGCMMQIGAALRAEDAEMGVAHPVELLDESYRRAGLYGGNGK